MNDGAGVEIRSTLTGLTGPVTWTVAPASSGVVRDFPDNLVATYLPGLSAPGATPEKVTITASAGGVSQSIQLDVKPSPPLVPYLDLPKLWTYGQLTDSGFQINGGSPVASAADQSGNLYLAYAKPVSEIKKVGPDGSITTFAHVGNPRSLAFGPNGVLYVVDSVANYTHAIRLIAPDGTMSTLTQTAPFDFKKGTIDGPSGVATAFSLSIVVSPAGAIYATDFSRIRAIASDGSFSTFAGGGCEVVEGPAPPCGTANDVVNGRGTEARFGGPYDPVTDAAGNLYVSDGPLIRKITPAGDVSILAGSTGRQATEIYEIDGTGSAARFLQGGPMTIDPAGNLYKISGSLKLRKITPSGVVSTVVTGLGGYYAMQPEFNIVSLSAGMPGVVVLQSSAALIKVKVD